MSKVLDTLKSGANFLSKHSPEILTGLAVVGLVSTVIMSVEATPKALEIIENEKEDRKNDLIESGKTEKEAEKLASKLPVKDTVKLCWKTYVPATLMGGVTIACIVCSTHISLKRNAALATLYTIGETWINKYQEKVIETIGPKKEQGIRDEIAKENLDANPVSKKDVIVLGTGNYLCYDDFSGRYFESSQEEIKRAQNEINSMINKNNYASVNDFYDELGLRPIDSGTDIGWNSDRELLDIDFSTMLADDGRPCLVISFHGTEPYKGFNKFG